MQRAALRWIIRRTTARCTSHVGTCKDNAKVDVAGAREQELHHVEPHHGTGTDALQLFISLVAQTHATQESGPDVSVPTKAQYPGCN